MASRLRLVGASSVWTHLAPPLQLEDYSDQELRLFSDHHLRGAEFLARHTLRIKAETSAKRRRGQTRRRTIVPGEHTTD
jgi:hypothetical protein